MLIGVETSNLGRYLTAPVQTSLIAPTGGSPFIRLVGLIGPKAENIITAGK